MRNGQMLNRCRVTTAVTMITHPQRTAGGVWLPRMADGGRWTTDDGGLWMTDSLSDHPLPSWLSAVSAFAIETSQQAPASSLSVDMTHDMTTSNRVDTTGNATYIETHSAQAIETHRTSGRYGGNSTGN